MTKLVYPRIARLLLHWKDNQCILRPLIISIVTKKTSQNIPNEEILKVLLLVKGARGTFQFILEIPTCAICSEREIKKGQKGTVKLPSPVDDKAIIQKILENVKIQRNRLINCTKNVKYWLYFYLPTIKTQTMKFILAFTYTNNNLLEGIIEENILLII